MTYDPTTPQQNVSPKDTQAQIQTNFSQFESIFSNNHTALNNNFKGKHEQVIFEKQTTIPNVVEDQVNLFAKDSVATLSTEPQLFAQIKKFLPFGRDETNAQNTPMQLTFNVVNTAGPQYQSFLPGGFIVYFGSISGNTTPNVNIDTTITLVPTPTTIIVAIAIPNTFTTVGKIIPFRVSTIVNTVTNADFRITSTANLGGVSIAYSFHYICIAKA